MAKERTCIATITVPNGSTGGLRTVADRLKSGLRATGKDLAITVDSRTKIASVRSHDSISEGDIRRVLSSCHVPYDLFYISSKLAGQSQTDSQSQQQIQISYPQEYGLLIAKSKKLVAELAESQRREAIAQARVSGLEKELAGARQRLSERVREYKELEARAEISSVQDLFTDMITRESKIWENFLGFTRDTLRTWSELYGVPEAELERECLDYYPLKEKPEYKEVEQDYERARKAIVLAGENPFVQVDPSAKEIVSRVDSMAQRDKNIAEAREDLRESDYIKQRKQRVLISSSKEDILITLPFKLKSQYPLLEKGLVEGIEVYLQGQRHIAYYQEDFGGLLRFRVSGAGKMARRRLPEAISSVEDCFTRLGGKREIVYMNIFC